MFNLFCPKETASGETRVALTPESAKRLQESGIACAIESGAGERAGFGDGDYLAAGARVATDRAGGLASADCVVSVQALEAGDAELIRRGTTTVSFLDPFRRPDLVAGLAAAGARAVSLEFIPRTTLAQKMDALSSQASLAGYAAVLLAAGRLDKILPMMMTPAGTLQPARFLVIGVGVAGLQAIATAKRLGARVTAYDTRPVVEEQVKSLGARFLKLDLGETGQTDQGYAKELTAAQLELQRKGMAKACADADAIITTAQVFGREAPRLLTRDMLSGMRRGSVVVDLAVSTGGNVEGSVSASEVVTAGGVHILGASSLPATIPQHASQALANNIANFILHFWNGGPEFDRDEEISRGAILTRDGAIINERAQPRS